ncbi:hypothetical protein APHAL10511_008279 [Amanita phalloides]|nr:hypothetical protein APHAL10511_008279 [Amanita phalloides]
MLHSIYDLTTFCRRTSGDVPAKLVGASTTVVGKSMYLFGGRLVSERRIVADMYVFDMESFSWERIPAHPDDHLPRHRYFHSADAWNNHLVVFGGMTNQPNSQNPDDLCVLNDVHFFDLSTRRWVLGPSLPQSPEANVPRARYAHLSAVTAGRLFIIGGQDFYNTWLDDICVLDLQTRSWVQRRDYPRHCGTYRSIAVASNMTVRSQDDFSHTSSILGNPGTRFKTDKINVPVDSDFTPSESLIHLPYSSPPSEDHPCDIYLYSNYNFTDVKRELEVFSPLPQADFAIQDRSATMTGSTFPPGLRFPNGAILGNNLVIAGTYLAHSYQSFSIWVLDLVNMTWSRIDPGKALETGSWFRACLWAETSKLIIFGNRDGNLVEDYNRRLLSWDHVAVVDLEAFGIYQPPQLKLGLRMQEFGLAALEERVMADFEIVCDDGRRIPCSRRLLDERWPWFRDQRVRMLQMALSTSQALPTSSMHTPLPSTPGTASVIAPDGTNTVAPDPRLTPRAFHLSEPYPITLAFLQYFYTQALITPLQHAPAVLSQLLVLSTLYALPYLEAIVRHAMHRMLSNSTSVAVYEVATLCSCRSLQIRALKTVMSYTQKKPVRNKSDGGGGSGGGDGGKPGGGSSGNDNDTFTSRPRGTSDAKWRTIGESSTTRADGGRTSGASQSERFTATAGRNEPLHRLNLNTGRHEIGHRRKAGSADSVQSDASDSFKIHAWHNHISATPGPLHGVKILNESTHSRSSSTSTDHTASDYGEQLQSGNTLTSFRTRSRAQSVSSKLATVSEQDNEPERRQEQVERQNRVKTRPRAQSAAGQLLRQFPVPPTPLRPITSMTQLSQRHALDEINSNVGNAPRTILPMNLRAPPIVIKDTSSVMPTPVRHIRPSDSKEPIEPGSWYLTDNTALMDTTGDAHQSLSLHSFTQPCPSPKASTYTISTSVSTSSYVSILHTPTDSLSGNSFEIVNSQPPTVDMKHKVSYGTPVPSDGGDIIMKHLVSVSVAPLAAQTLTPSSASGSTTHSPITPSSSQSSFQRLLSKVSLGKDNNKDGNSVSGAGAKRKKRDESSILGGLVGYSLP